MAIQRLRLGNNIYMDKKEKLEVSATNTYNMVDLALNDISECFDVDFNIDEIINISKFILANDASVISIIEEDINSLENKTFVSQLIGEVGKRLGYDLTYDEELQANLYKFILSFNYRQRYGMQVYNPYLKEIKLRYAGIFQAVKSSFLFLKPRAMGAVNNGEIGYMVPYFIAALEIQNRINVFILHGVEYSIANLLSTRLRLMFNFNIVGMASINEMLKMLDKHRIDLIITTYDISVSEDIPSITVNPLLAEEDIALIQEYIKTHMAENKTNEYNNF